MSLENSIFITFFAARMHWKNHFVVSILLAFHYWTLCIDDNLRYSTTNTRHFGHCKQEKYQIFMQQKTIFLNFYKTKDYFFDLVIKTKDLCSQYICSWESPEAYPQKCSSKRTNTFLEEHHWGTASGTFGNVLHYFSVI